MSNIGVSNRNGWSIGAAAYPPPRSSGGDPPDRPSSAAASWRPAVMLQVESDLRRWEGNLNFLYLDSKGLVTTGIGNLVRNEATAQRMPFVDTRTGRPATADQISQAYDVVQSLPAKRHADSYAPATHLRLPQEFVNQLMRSRLENEFLPGLRRELPHFDDYPPAAQRALIDMAYSMGLGKLGTFHKLRDACEAGDWMTAAAECHRMGARAERNEWTRDLFLLAGGVRS
jgi:GH24 family phage-related lysozyme (muramidase)